MIRNQISNISASISEKDNVNNAKAINLFCFVLNKAVRIIKIYRYCHEFEQTFRSRKEFVGNKMTKKILKEELHGLHNRCGNIM